MRFNLQHINSLNLVYRVNSFSWRQTRVVHWSILCDPIQPSWLTQPDSTQRCKWENLDPTRPNPSQPITTNNGAYSLVVTYFYAQNLSRTLRNQASTYSCSYSCVIMSLRNKLFREMFKMSSAAAQQASTKAPSHKLSCWAQPDPTQPNPTQSMDNSVTDGAPPVGAVAARGCLPPGANVLCFRPRQLDRQLIFLWLQRWHWHGLSQTVTYAKLGGV